MTFLLTSTLYVHVYMYDEDDEDLDDAEPALPEMVARRGHPGSAELPAMGVA